MRAKRFVVVNPNHRDVAQNVELCVAACLKDLYRAVIECGEHPGRARQMLDPGAKLGEVVAIAARLVHRSLEPGALLRAAKRSAKAFSARIGGGSAFFKCSLVFIFFAIAFSGAYLTREVCHNNVHRKKRNRGIWDSPFAKYCAPEAVRSFRE